MLLPSRLKLLAWGSNRAAGHGVVRVGGRTLAELPRNQRERGFELVALDFEHNTVPGTPEFQRSREPREVAAFGVPEVVQGEGLFLRDIRWTPAGQRAAANFPDLSAAPQLDPAGEVVFLHSAALTRAGSVPGVHLALNSACSISEGGLARVSELYRRQIDSVYGRAAR